MSYILNLRTQNIDFFKQYGIPSHCFHCSKTFDNNEPLIYCKSINTWWQSNGIWLHPKCGEQMAMLIIKDAKEIEEKLK
jgi:hypothetical protein